MFNYNNAIKVNDNQYDYQFAYYKLNRSSME